MLNIEKKEGWPNCNTSNFLKSFWRKIFEIFTKNTQRKMSERVALLVIGK